MPTWQADACGWLYAEMILLLLIRPSTTLCHYNYLKLFCLQKSVSHCIRVFLFSVVYFLQAASR